MCCATYRWFREHCVQPINDPDIILSIHLSLHPPSQSMIQPTKYPFIILPSIHLSSIYQSTNPSPINLSIHQFIYLSCFSRVAPSISQTIQQPDILPFIHLSFSPSTHPANQLMTQPIIHHLAIFWFIHQSTNPSTNQTIHPSINPNNQISVHSSINLFRQAANQQSNWPNTFLSIIYPSIH